jgi:hypothetical protein
MVKSDTVDAERELVGLGQNGPSRGMVEMFSRTASGLFLGSRHNPILSPSIRGRSIFIIHLSL